MGIFGGIFQSKAKRPRIRPARTGLDRILWFIAINLALTCVVYAAWWYPSLPATIPTGLGPNGQPRGAGPAWSIFAMPGLGLILVAIMLLLQRWPWLSNTVVEITEENAEVQYRLVNRLLSLVAIEVAIIFLLVTWQLVETAQGRVGNATLPVILFATASWLPLLGWYFWASLKEA